MIDGLKPYHAMKDSGVPWLDSVPENWSVLRGRRLFEIKKTIAGELGHAVLSVTQGGLRVRDVESNEGQVSQDYSKYQMVNAGDFVMNSMDLITGGVGIADRAGVTSPDYRVFVIRDITRCRDRYFLHAFRTLYANRGFYAWGQGSAQLGRWRLPRKRFNDFPFPLPPVVEQAAIVRFLDHADRRIRRYIRAKQKLIKLLEEQKQAIIHRAVTHGLDPNVRLKPSGVEWLGEVPEHWVVRRGKFVFKCVDVRSTMGSEELLTVSSREGVVPRAGRNVTMFMAASYVGHKLCWPEDLVINSLWAWANGLGFSSHRGIVSTAYGVYRLREPFRELWQYLNLALRSGAYDWQFRVRSKGIWKSRLQLTDWSFLDMPIVLPPKGEAVSICQRLADETAELQAAVYTAEREISLLREYRTRLIADVVTGKLDVREAAARLPDEMVEPEPLDETEAEGDSEYDRDNDIDEVSEEVEV